MAALRKKLYRVIDNAGNERVIRALTKNGAVNYAARDTFVAELLDPETAMELAQRGITVEDATEEEDVPSTATEEERQRAAA